MVMNRTTPGSLRSLPALMLIQLELLRCLSDLSQYFCPGDGRGVYNNPRLVYAKCVVLGMRSVSPMPLGMFLKLDDFNDLDYVHNPVFRVFTTLVRYFHKTSLRLRACSIYSYYIH